MPVAKTTGRKTTAIEIVAAVAAKAMDVVNAGLAKRYRAERRFRMYGMISVGLGMLFLSILLFDIISKGHTAFRQTQLTFEVFFDPEVIDPEGTRDLEAIARAYFRKIARQPLRELFPEVSGRRDKRALNSILSSGAPFQLLEMVRENPDLIGTRQTVSLLADDDIDMLVKGYIDRDLPEEDQQRIVEVIRSLEESGTITIGKGGKDAEMVS